MLGCARIIGVSVRTMIALAIAQLLVAFVSPVFAQDYQQSQQDELNAESANDATSQLTESDNVDDQSEIEKVQFVEVQLQFLDGDLRPELTDDLQKAIAEVGEMAIIHQLEGDLIYIKDNLDDITDTLKRVIDLTLSKRGFSVDKLSISPGVTTLFTIEISVSGGEIIDIEIDVLPPNAGNLANELLSPLKSELTSSLRRRFQGLPTSDINWLYKLFDEAIKEEQENIEDFKWFAYRFELSPGPITRVILHLSPKSSSTVVSNHSLRTRSSTLLNISLEDLREVIIREVSCLDGMPLEFVDSYVETIEMYLSKRVENLKTLRFYQARADIAIEFKGRDLQISAIVESRRFRTSVSGQVDFDKDEENPLLEGRIGVIGGKYAELYAHVKFFPDNIDFEPELGFGLNPTPGIFLGSGWDFDREALKLRGDVWFGTNVLVSAEQYTDSEYNDDSKYSLSYYFTRDIRISATLDGAGSGFFSLGVVL